MAWDDLADAAAMRPKDVERGVHSLSDLGLIAFDSTIGAWFVPKWNERQFESDLSTDRTAKHRSMQRPKNVDATHQIQRQNTETDTEAENKTLKSSDDDFAEFWKQYPTRSNGGSKGSRKNALAVWKRLSPEKRSLALSSLPIYAKAKNGYPKDAERYLRSEEWEGLENVVSYPERESEYQWL